MDAQRFVASLYVWRAREAGRLPAEGAEVGEVIPEAALNQLGQRALELIHAGAADGRLRDAPFYWDIVLSWAQLEDSDKARAWLMETAESSPTNLAKVLKGLLGMSIGDDQRRQYSFHGFRSDRDFFDPDRLRKAAERYAEDPGLDDDERARIVAMRDSLRRSSLQVSNPE